jgi:hypothetical protein
MVLVVKWKTYLTENKCIEYHCILHNCSMFPVVLIQIENAQALEVEHKENSNLI